MWVGIATALQIIMMVLKWWLGLDAEKKAKVEALREEIPHAKTTSDITKLFDSINSF